MLSFTMLRRSINSRIYKIHNLKPRPNFNHAYPYGRIRAEKTRIGSFAYFYMFNDFIHNFVRQAITDSLKNQLKHQSYREIR